MRGYEVVEGTSMTTEMTIECQLIREEEEEKKKKPSSRGRRIIEVPDSAVGSDRSETLTARDQQFHLALQVAGGPRSDDRERCGGRDALSMG